MTKHKIAIVVGSIRKDSLNRKVARAICVASPEEFDCHIVEIDDLPLYDPDLDANPPAPWARFRSEIADADGVLFVTPEYNRSVPGVLKNAIDVGSRPYGKSVFSKKPAAIFSGSPGMTGGFGSNHHLRQSCVFLDMPVMQQPEAYWGLLNDDKLGMDGTVHDETLAKLVKGFAGALADWYDLIRKGRDKLA